MSYCSSLIVGFGLNYCLVVFVTSLCSVTWCCQEPHNADQAKLALESQGVYLAGVSLWWLDFISSPAPGVPLSRTRTLDLGYFLFPDGPTFIAEEAIMVVAPYDDPPPQCHDLKLITPEEKVHAILLACSEQLQAARQAGDRDRLEWLKKRWTDVMRSVPCTFLRIEQKAIYSKAFNMRQRVVQEHESLARTALQLVFQLMAFKALRIASPEPAPSWDYRAPTPSPDPPCLAKPSTPNPNPPLGFVTPNVRGTHGGSGWR